MDRRTFLGAVGVGAAAVAALPAAGGDPGPARRRALRKGAALEPGAIIGVVAPASTPMRRSDLARGQAFWESRGFRVRVEPQTLERDGYLAGPAARRAEVLQALFADPAVAAVHVAGGGFGSTQLIPHLDFERIARTPKAFIGRSDITALHLALQRQAGLVTFYGPGLASVAPPTGSRFAEEGLLRALTTRGPLGRLPPHPDDAFVQTVRGGRASGPLLGGCLWPLGKAVGTPWAPDLDGAIFFFEETDEPPWSIDAHLTHLEQAGVLERVAGVVVGRMVNCDWSASRPEYPSNLTLDEVLERHFAHRAIPCLYGLPVGHEPQTLTLPLGVQATLDASAGTLTLDEAALR